MCQQHGTGFSPCACDPAGSDSASGNDNGAGTTGGASGSQAPAAGQPPTGGQPTGGHSGAPSDPPQQDAGAGGSAGQDPSLPTGGTAGAGGEGTAGSGGEGMAGTGGEGTAGSGGEGTAGSGGEGTAGAGGPTGTGSGNSTCGSGGLTGTQVQVDFEGSLYYITTPAGYDESREWPLILGFHGDEGDPASSVNWSWRSVVDGTFIFVAPKASNADGSWYAAMDQNSEWVDKLMESLFSQYNIDLDRVYLWGLSGGAVFVSGYGMARQDVFAAIQFNMGGSYWSWRGVGSPSPAQCKIPARFVVSLDDFLRDDAITLYDALTNEGHETEWVDANCSGHCWDDVESGVGARDWLLAHTYCGTLRPPGCEGPASD